ncbi:translation initiation factor eIF-1A [Candidatus Pacearchaeota archaeon]|nr:translation initiation factor eIF-1A [Candidatus Pacearchaeota archaeon]
MAFGKFKDKSKPNKEKVFVAGEEKVVRIKLPRGREVIGIIAQRCGGSRMIVSCMDGKTRNCKVPGRKRRGLWLREGDAIIVEPWEFDDEKGEVLYKYTDNQVVKLKEMGKLTTSDEEF